MKKILLSLFVGLIGLINFGYCTYFEPTYTWKFINGSSEFNCSGFCCFDTSSTNSSYKSQLTLTYGNTSENFGQLSYNKHLCIDYNGTFSLSFSNSINQYVYVYDFTSLVSSNCPTCPTCPTCPEQYTSLECQNEYNLIPISSVDQNYCTINGLCPSGGGDCPVCPGSGDNWSALYINDIQHLGKPIINITFPDYLDWDYTTTGDEFNLDIVGYPVDTEYIDGIIRTQNYKPTSEDFTQLVGMLAPYSKYLLFLLFIFIIWAWIKKPFKSKKL